MKASIEGQDIMLGERGYNGSKPFSTGSKGYHGNGKLLINGVKFQANLTLVEVGSKPTSGEAIREDGTRVYAEGASGFSKSKTRK